MNKKPEGMRCDHLGGKCVCCGDNECALFGEKHAHPQQPEGEMGEYRKQIVKSLSKIQVEMMNSCGGGGIEQEDEDMIEREADGLIGKLRTLLSQAREEARREAVEDIKEFLLTQETDMTVHRIEIDGRVTAIKLNELFDQISQSIKEKRR